MPITSIIDIEFLYYSPKKINVEERIVVPLGNKIIFRLLPNPNMDLPRNMLLQVNLFFESRSPFSWRNQKYNAFDKFRPGVPFEIASGNAQQEGEYKYGITIQDLGPRGFRYDEDPYLIIRKF